MAVYRSDQAQFTFAAEAGDGGSPEIAASSTYLTGNHIGKLNRQANPGDKSIAVKDSSGDGTAFQGTISTALANCWLAIGTNSSATTSALASDTEIRRVVFVDGGEIYLDMPLAFPHADSVDVKQVSTAASGVADDLATMITAPTSNANSTTSYDKLVTWVPGVYETIDTPDPQEAMEPRYMLGQNTKRNAYQIYKGQQTFTGSVSGMVLLNGMPLRFPLGTVVSQPETASSVANTTAAGTAGSTRLRLSASSGTGVVKNGDVICIEYASSTPTATSKMEIRQIVSGQPAAHIADGSSANVKLNYPLFFDHTAATVHAVASPAYYVHHIFEQTDLSRVSWNVNVKDENGENTFQRRYFGGLIGSMTIAAEEGGLLTCGWDTATFLGMVHNLQDAGRSTLPLRKFTPMHDITKNDIGTPTIGARSGSAGSYVTSDIRSLPSTEPYYFSEGNVKMWGQTVARVRNFSINVTNGEEVRYYIRRADPDNRGPFEVRPGQRGYTMSATIGLPDAGTTNNGFSDADQMSLWKELILSGDYTAADSSSATGHAGFNIELQFTRGGNANDTLTIRIPNDYDGSSEGTGATTANQGAIIQTAPVPIDGATPLEQSANIIFKSMKIEVSDGEPFYP